MRTNINLKNECIHARISLSPSVSDHVFLAPALLPLSNPFSTLQAPPLLGYEVELDPSLIFWTEAPQPVPLLSCC